MEDDPKSSPPKIGGNVLINGRTAVHAGSGGVLTSIDVCLTKVGKSTVPIPYTNVARSKDAAQTASTVFINGHPVCHKNSIFSKSTGDEPGNRKGIRSGTIAEKAEFVTASSNVFIEGVAAVRQGDYMVSNNCNTAPMPLSQPGAEQPKSNDIEDAKGLDEHDLPYAVPLKMSGDRLHIQNDLIAIAEPLEKDRDSVIEGRSDDFIPAGSTTAIEIIGAQQDGQAKSPPKPELVIGVFFDGTGNNMLAQPPERHTNVAKLHDMYPIDANNQFYQRRVYIEGVGTKAVSNGNGQFREDDSALGLGTGFGDYGAGPRLLEARDDIQRILNEYQDIHDLPEKVTFDIFGFSRGAMLARHFANMVQGGLPDLQQPLGRERSSIWPALRSAKASNPAEDMYPAETLYPPLPAEVRIRFLGLFDSVGSFGLPGDDDEGFVNPYLASGTADFVYHLTSRDEIRQNFPLTRIVPGDPAWVEEDTFGVHSDVGGGYDNVPERILIEGARAHFRPKFPFSYNDRANWQQEMQALALKMSERCGIDCRVDFHSESVADFFEVRHTRNDLARVSLKAMYDMAVSKGVPLRSIDPNDVISSELATLVKEAKAGDLDALKQLDDNFIHTSHRNFCLAYARETIGMKPETDGRRDIFPNQPDRALTFEPELVTRIK